ncbi:MAG: hypothetical protein JSU94_03230, partial [Phycisphaerales bacterium]
EEQLTRVIHQFGKRGPLADMKLCLADASLMIPQQYNQPIPLYYSSNEQEKKPELEKIAAKYRDMLNLVCKIQVRMFLKDPDLLERYYNVVIWSEVFLKDHGPMEMGQWWSLLRKLGLDWDSMDGDDYWWYAREFVLLAHATGRDDLLRDGDSMELYEACEKWRAWMWTNIWKDTSWTRFFPHPDKPIWVERDSLLAVGRGLVKKPSLPFPDWDMKVLPPPPKRSLSAISEYEWAEPFGDRIGVLEVRAQCGESAGVASDVTELPHFGKAISHFPVEGGIVYSSLDYCCSAEACLGKYADVLFAGAADKDDVIEYCRENGWSFTSAGAYTDYWSDIVRRHANSVDPNDFAIASASRDYELFKNALVIKGDCSGNPAQLRINYNSKENRFTGHAWCLIRRSRKPEETRQL